MDTPKRCPLCNSPLRLYEWSSAKPPFHLSLAFDALAVVIFLIIFGLIPFEGESRWIIALVVACALAFVILRKPLQRIKMTAIAEHGRYYCDACSQHFEGAALRQITK